MPRWDRYVAIVCAVGGMLAARSPIAAGAPHDSGATGRLEDQVATLRTEADRLSDVEAVKKLQRAYGYYLDKGYWGEAAALFADDATMEVGVDGVYVGRARIRERLIREGGGNPGPGLPYGQIYHRMQLQPVVDVARDGRTAKGRWREIAILGHYHHDAEWGAGIYENDYVKENGVWKIARLHYYPNFLAPYEGGWAKLAPAGHDWKSAVGRSFPADRPPTVVYAPFPDRFTPPFHYDPVRSGRAPGLRSALRETRELGASGGAADRLARELEAGGNSDSARERAALGGAARALARLESHEAIERLQAAYGYYIDKGLWDRAAALFSDDATYEFGQRGVYTGRRHIRRALELMGPRGLENGQLNDYPMLQPIIDVAPDNRTAKARWRSDVMLARGGKGEWGEGVYENDYVNENGVWRIAKLHYYATFFADYDKGWGSGNIPLAGPSREIPPDRPPTEVYQSLPGVYVPPYHYSNPVASAKPMEDESLLSADSSPSAGALRASIDTLAKETARLASLFQIEKVQRSYGYYVDKAQWPEVAKLFAANGTYEIGGRGIFIGPKRVLEYLVKGLGPIGMASRTGQLLDHQQFQGIVDVAPDGKRAWGRWTAIVMGGTANGSAIWGDCYYENSYINENGIWKLDHVRAAFNMYAPYKGGWRDGSVPNTRPDSFPPPPDLPPSHIYLTYPNFYVLPCHYANPVTGRPAPPPNPAAGGTAPMRDYAR
ncbi:MAG TPA: nuclear transport factor 2 family protein [Steroidobacteraceae bacterium]|nr:nuclear transport factor 2 family protein [Steroidobacteraceae bacterium]